MIETCDELLQVQRKAIKDKTYYDSVLSLERKMAKAIDRPKKETKAAKKKSSPAYPAREGQVNPSDPKMVILFDRGPISNDDKEK